ncbi:MAG: RidA family protein [Rhodospirillales bacterium]|jgi:enamine deaminase RidA (YjgF/YER057c/UK114 family)|nr:RidA family protein [Rhodospirillales bacterium]
MAGRIDARLAELGIVIPEPPVPVASYQPYCITGNLVVVAGQVTLEDGKVKYKGRLGDDLSLEDGEAATRLCAVNVLAQVKAACDGDLDRVKQVVRLNAFFNSTPDFLDHPRVMNAASDMMAEIFGESGKHTRVGVGVSSLPLGVPVELDGIFEIE